MKGIGQSQPFLYLSLPKFGLSLRGGGCTGANDILLFQFDL
jgi:hypothetical protein